MLHILICEDDTGQRMYMEHVIKEHIATKNSEIKLVLSASDPTQVLAYIKAHPNKRGLYFLDIDLQHDKINGIELGAKIRETDPFAKIIFATAYSELAYLTFKYKIGALDYIVKDKPENIQTRIRECINIAHEHYLQEEQEQMKYFKIEANSEIWTIPYDDILFFETHADIRHRVVLHKENSKIDFRGFLSEIEKLIPDFYRCHKSYLLNVSKINYIDKLTREAVMTSGKRVLIAKKKMPKLVDIFGNDKQIFEL